MPEIIQQIPPESLKKLETALETFNASIKPGNTSMVKRIDDASAQCLKALKSEDISGCAIAGAADALLRLIKEQPKPINLGRWTIPTE